MKKLLTKYLASITVSGLMACFVLWINQFDQVTVPAERIRLLADAFTVPGVLAIMLAALIWVASDGFFDGIGYAGRVTARMLLPFLKIEEEKFYDYKMRKADHRIHGYSFIFYTGLVFLAIAVGFIIRFYTLS